MELFNKYKNKNFAFITNYINSCLNDDSLALTEDELREQLSGASQSSFEEFLLALTNAYDNSESYNADILYRHDDFMIPLRQIPIPVRASLTEKAWLYYILQNSKSDLFLEPATKQKLILALELLSPDNKLSVTNEVLTNFKTIVSAIKQHRRLFVTNTTFSGQIYKNQEVYPYKLEYSVQFDSFSLSCYPLDTKRPVKMNLANLSAVKMGDEIVEYNQFLSDFEKQLKNTKEKIPVSIEIRNQAEAYDRCAYLFSSYDTFCYDKGNDTLLMSIYYYRFQKDEIIRNILFLGHYVKVVSPKNIVDEVISNISAAYNTYC